MAWPLTIGRWIIGGSHDFGQVAVTEMTCTLLNLSGSNSGGE
jgi:hypothetical protein